MEEGSEEKITTKEGQVVTLATEERTTEGRHEVRKERRNEGTNEGQQRAEEGIYICVCMCTLYMHKHMCARAPVIVEFKTPGAGIKREGRKESTGMKEGKAKEWRLKEGQGTEGTK